MAVTMEVVYEGGLHCAITHGPSGSRIVTDAPVDNRGKGEAFSPTDLSGASLGSCMLTTMGIVAQDRGWDMTGATARVTKEMGATPRRHIATLTVAITLPKALDAKARTVLERTAQTCPVHTSLGDLTAIELSFRYV
jgi:putative redox protein